jgi:hypothetical protein
LWNGSRSSRWSSGGRSLLALTSIEGDGGVWSGRSRRSGGSSVGTVKLDSNLLEGIESLFGGGVDGEDHTLSAVRSSALLAVPPGWLLGSYGVLPSWGGNDGVVRIWEKTGVELGASLLNAGVVKGGLRYGVVLLVEDEVNKVTDFCLDVLWSVDKTGITSDDDLKMLAGKFFTNEC